MSILIYLPFILFSAVALIWFVVPLVIELQVRRGKVVTRAPRPRPRFVVIQGGGKPAVAPKSRIA
jgi:hypothetical protein